jgi:hypothetical protein
VHNRIDGIYPNAFREGLRRVAKTSLTFDLFERTLNDFAMLELDEPLHSIYDLMLDDYDKDILAY